MKNKKKYWVIFLLTLSCLCYNMPYLSLTFYNQFLDAFKITNTQSGLLLTMFGLTATPGYLFGGMLADKFNPKKLVILSSLLTAIVGVVLLFMNSFSGMMICYLIFGVTTTFIQWSAFVKLVRAQAEKGNEGKTFGFFELCYAAVGAITSYGILALLGNIAKYVGFKGVLGVYAGLLLIISLLIALLIKDVPGDVSSESFDFKMIKKALAHPVTWLNGFIVMGFYILITGLTYFNPYLTSTFGFVVAFGTSFAIFNRTLARMVFTPLGGVLLDKWKTPKLLIVTSIGMIILLVTLSLIPQQPSAGILALVLMILIVVLLSSGRSAMYTPIPEANIPYEITGTALGITSAIGYSTDLWLYTLCGKWLDNGGKNGYQYIIYLFIAGLVVVIVSALLLHAYEKKHSIEKNNTVKGLPAD